MADSFCSTSPIALRPNYFMKYGLQSMLQLHRFFPGAFVLLVVAFASVCSMSQISEITVASAAPVEPFGAKGAPSHKTRAQPPAPSCSAVGFLPIQPSPPATAQHKVTLSWKASVPSADPVFGYCLYKSQTTIDSNLGVTCPKCEPLNSVPVKGTSCVDDIVTNGATYYYIVRAVDVRGNPSPWSNVATVPIPSSNQTSAVPQGSPQPQFCRVPSSTK